MTQRKNLTNMLGTAALATTLAGSAIAQDQERPSWLSDERLAQVKQIIAEEQAKAERENGKFSFETRAATGIDGVTTQNLFNYSVGDFSAKTLWQHKPNSVNTYGVKLDTSNWGSEFNMIDGVQNSYEGLFKIKSGDDFVGGFFDALPSGDKAGLMGRLTLGDDFRLEATADTDGAARFVVFPSVENGALSIGGGVNPDNGLVGNISYNNDNMWVVFRGGDRPIDTRFVFGDVFTGKSRLYGSVDGSGINELKAIGNETFQFGIGNNPRFEFTEELSFLGKEQGDTAGFFRYIEDSKMYGNVAYRLGDLGPLDDSAISIGAYRTLVPGNEVNGFTAEFESNLFDNDNFSWRVKADVNEEREAVGFYFSAKF